MAIDCELIPRREATREQLRQLGSALGEWCQRESSDEGILHYISRDVLADLSNGNQPPTFADQYEAMCDEAHSFFAPPPERTAEEKRKRLIALKEQFGTRVMRRCVFFQVRGNYPERRRAVLNLRAAVPAELVEDLLILDRSWTQD
jgi:hypothetical protein